VEGKGSYHLLPTPPFIFKMKNPDKCSTKRCNHEYGLTYLGKKLCWKCWENQCKKEQLQILKSLKPQKELGVYL